MIQSLIAQVGLPLLISFGINMALAIYLILQFALVKGMSWKFLLAKLKGSPLFASLEQTGTLRLVTGNYKEGLLINKRGGYLVNESAIYNWENGTPGGVLYNPTSVNINPDLVRLMTECKEGIKMKNGKLVIRDFGELEAIVREWEENHKGEPLMIPLSPTVDVRELEKKLKGEEDKKGVVEAIEKGIGEMIRLQDVLDFFEYQMTTAEIGSRIESVVKAKMEKINKGGMDPMKIAMFLILVAVAGAIAWVMFHETGTIKVGKCLQLMGQGGNATAVGKAASGPLSGIG